MKTTQDHARRNQPTAAKGRRRSRGAFAACGALLLAGGALPPAAEAVTITFKAGATPVAPGSADLTLNSNYTYTNSGVTAPGNTTDIRLTSTNTSLTLTSANSFTTQSFNVTNGLSYTIQNTASGATNQTITLGNAAGVNNSLATGASSASNANLDLLFLGNGSGNSALSILGTNSGAGTGTLGLVLASGGQFDTAAGTTLSISANVSGFYALTKVGTGTLNLSGNNSFTSYMATNGVTNLGANGALGGVTTLTVGAAGTVSLSAAVLNAGTTSLTNVINDGAAVSINGGTAGGILNLAGATETVGSLSSGSAKALLVIGDYTNTTTNAVTAGGFTVGDGTTTTYAGVISGAHTGAGAAFTKQGGGTLTLSGANTFTGGVALNGGVLALAADDVMGVSNPLGLSGTISFGGGTLQYSASNTFDYSPRFSNAANQAYSIDTNNQNVTLASALTSAGGSLTKLGTGNLLLSGANTFTGAVNINGGGLRASVAENPGVSGPLGQGGIISFNGGSLQYSTVNHYDYSSRFSTASGQSFQVNTNSQDVTWASALGGAGNSLTKLGAGTLTLGGASTFSGVVTLTAGTVALASAENAGVSGPLGVGGAIVFNGGTLQYSANNTYDYSARFDTRTNQSYNIDTNGQNVTFGSALNNSSSGNANGLTKIGLGTLTLNAANTFTGGVMITAGAVALGIAENPGFAGPLGQNGIITLNGGTLQYSSSNTTDYSSRFSAADGQSFRINTNGQTVTLASALVSNTGTLNKFGNGTLILGGASTYNGTSTLSAGVLRVNSAENAGTSGPLGVNGGIVFSGGTLQYSANNNFDYSSRFSNAANQAYIINTNGVNVTLASNLTSSGGSLNKQAGGTLTIMGANTFNGGVAINGGAVSLGSAENPGVSGPLGMGGTITLGGGTLQYTAANTYDYSSRFSTAANQAYNIATNGQSVTLASDLTSSGGTMNKLGQGMLSLSGNNTYTGGTTVSAGTLQISNAVGTSATGSGAVTVASGATLQGLGSLNSGGSLITVNGMLSPGSAATPVGTISLSSSAPVGALTLASTSNLMFDITNASSKDLVSLSSSSLALNGGTLTLNLPGNGFDYGGTYALFTGVGGLSLANAGSPFSAVNGYDNTNYAAVFTLNGSEYDLTFSALSTVPEPSGLASCVALLTVLAGGTGWRARGRVREWLAAR